MIWLVAIAGFLIGALAATVIVIFWAARVAERYDDVRGGYDD